MDPLIKYTIFSLGCNKQQICFIFYHARLTWKFSIFEHLFLYRPMSYILGGWYSSIMLVSFHVLNQFTKWYFSFTIRIGTVDQSVNAFLFVWNHGIFRKKFSTPTICILAFESRSFQIQQLFHDWIIIRRNKSATWTFDQIFSVASFAVLTDLMLGHALIPFRFSCFGTTFTNVALQFFMQHLTHIVRCHFETSENSKNSELHRVTKMIRIRRDSGVQTKIQKKLSPRSWWIVKSCLKWEKRL